MEGEKKTTQGAKLQLNRRAGLAAGAVEVGFTVMNGFDSMKSCVQL